MMNAETAKLKQEVSQLRQDVGAVAAEATRNSMQKLGLAREQLAQRYHNISDASYQYVVKHPTGTLATVAVLGIALGYLLGHRRSDLDR